MGGRMKVREVKSERQTKSARGERRDEWRREQSDKAVQDKGKQVEWMGKELSEKHNLSLKWVNSERISTIFKHYTHSEYCAQAYKR